MRRFTQGLEDYPWPTSVQGPVDQVIADFGSRLAAAQRCQQASTVVEAVNAMVGLVGSHSTGSSTPTRSVDSSASNWRATDPHTPIRQLWTTPVPGQMSQRRLAPPTGTVVPSRGSGQRARTDHVKP